MTDHEKLRAARLRIAIGRARYAMAGDAPPTLGDLEDIISAAESWDRLEWKHRGRPPVKDGQYVVKILHVSALAVARYSAGRWHCDRAFDYYLDGSLPAIPEPTDG